jgi:erythromycin esterase-like protein
MVRKRHLLDLERPASEELLATVRSRSRRLHHPTDLDPLLDRIGDARYVLLGEASHGTHEYYTWRAALSRRLIEEKHFSFLAVEGDWPDCYRVNRYVKGYTDAGDSARDVLHHYERWPTWMWANEEIVELTEWLRGHNASLSPTEQVGFYGLDVYSLWDSLYQVLGYLHKYAPEALPAARRAFACFEPYGADVQEYARATRWVDESCETEVVNLLTQLRRAPAGQAPDDREAHFNAEQNALVVHNAEHYYRTMVRGGPQSWNVRDHHMVLTLERLMRWHGPRSKAIVWAHNTDIGDARFTDMADDGTVNVGQLIREGHTPDDVVLVGFGSYRGRVIAGSEWEAPQQRMEVPPARPDSWEDMLNRAGPADRLLLLDGLRGDRAWLARLSHRAIGVVYHPTLEHLGNYVPTVLPRRYDAFLFLHETQALRPLHGVEVHDEGEVPETYPTGV